MAEYTGVIVVVAGIILLFTLGVWQQNKGAASIKKAEKELGKEADQKDIHLSVIAAFNDDKKILLGQRTSSATLYDTDQISSWDIEWVSKTHGNLLLKSDFKLRINFNNAQKPPVYISMKNEAQANRWDEILKQMCGTESANNTASAPSEAN